MTTESFLNKSKVIKGLDNCCFPALVEQSISGELPVELYEWYNQTAQYASGEDAVDWLCQRVVDAAFPAVPDAERKIAWRVVRSVTALSEIMEVCRANNLNVGIFVTEDHIVKVNATDDPNVWEVLDWREGEEGIELERKQKHILGLFNMMHRATRRDESSTNLVVFPAEK